MFTDNFNGTYVACKFIDETLDYIQQIQEELRVPNPVPRDELHSTIIYSTVNVPFIPDDAPEKLASTAYLRVFETPTKNVLVLAYESDYLQKRHYYGELLGATYDFEEFIPHITIAKDIGPLEYEGVYEFPIVSSHEYVEDLDLSAE
ncbi:RNA ligase [Aeromonas phage GomatiRiver_11]|nr:hypothetical protein OBDJBBDK_00212 [Aeromonas phage AhFM11]WKW84381.1 RNA ligase [Aeromonas phage GomatiRiver_11]